MKRKSDNGVRNTDHASYSRRNSLTEMERPANVNVNELREQLSNYFAGASDEAQSSSSIADTKNDPPNGKATNENKYPAFKIKPQSNTQSGSKLSELKEEMSDYMSTSSIQSNKEEKTKNARRPSKPRLSESEKYYRHKRRFNRRLEKRLDAALLVMCEIIKYKYPAIDITLLETTYTSLVSDMDNVINSDSDDSDENNINITD